jgi:hypothetical protein
MSVIVELIPISEGNHITVKENEKVIVGRGSSLGVCLLTHRTRSTMIDDDFIF